jgi:hypothetical protein
MLAFKLMAWWLRLGRREIARQTAGDADGGARAG